VLRQQPELFGQVASTPTAGCVTLDFDATLVEVESENKEQAAPNYKHGFGYHPLLVYLKTVPATSDPPIRLFYPARPPLQALNEKFRLADADTSDL
jgi:hypothetical protein